MIKKLLLFLVVILVSVNVYAVLPPEGNPGVDTGNQKWGDFACWYKCHIVRDQVCLNACGESVKTCETNEFGQERCVYDREAQAICSKPCHIKAGQCVSSCKRQTYSGVDFDNFRELELEQGCKGEDRDSSGCCEGYKISDFGVCCRDGFTAKKNENGVYCDMDSEEKILKNVIITANSEFNYGTNDTFDFSMKFIMVDEKGKNVNNAEIKYPGQIVVEPVSEDLKGKINFEVELDSPITDSSGMIRGILKLSSTSIDENTPNSIKMNIYNSELSNVKKSFTFKTPKIKIIDVVKLTEGLQWQDSWGTYEVRVFDPYSSKKRYVLGANGGTLRVDGVEYGDLASITSKKNSLKFGWKAPKITKDMRLNYGTKIVTTAVDLAIKKAEGGKGKFKDKLANKKARLQTKERLTNHMKKSGVDVGDDLSNIQKGLDSLDDLELAIKGIEQEEALLSHITNMKKFMEMGEAEKERLKQNPDKAYAYARMALQSAAMVEGLLGQFGISSFPVSAMLGVSQAFFEITDEMNKIAASKVITKDFTISVRVESKKGSSTYPKRVKIEGYEMVLKEETFIPFS